MGAALRSTSSSTTCRVGKTSKRKFLMRLSSDLDAVTLATGTLLLPSWLVGSLFRVWERGGAAVCGSFDARRGYSAKFA